MILIFAVLLMILNVIILVKGMGYITDLTRNQELVDVFGLPAGYKDIVTPIIRGIVFFLLAFGPTTILLVIVEYFEKQRQVSA